jgi:hypothetical protein
MTGKEKQDMTSSTGKHFKKLVKSALAVMLLMMALSCSKSGSELVGVWDNTRSHEIVEFKQDGSGVFMYPNSPNPPLTFSWNQSSKNNYILDVNFLGTRKTLTATINDKSMSIESTMGRELYQKRIGN